MSAPVGRFAPTPSGRMHLGNVFAALIAWLSVRSRNGSLVLRMEDLDTQRTSAEFAQVLRADYSVQIIIFAFTRLAGIKIISHIKKKLYTNIYLIFKNVIMIISLLIC